MVALIVGHCMHTGPGYDGVFCGADYRLRDIFLKHLATRESVQFQVCPIT
jgi:hypothetical protein